MSRSGYSDDCDPWALIRWRGAVKSATRGARGQAMLRELLAALDAMPIKELITDEFEHAGGFCALGVLGKQRGVDMTGLDPYDMESVAGNFNIAEALAAEIMFENDEERWCWSTDRRHKTPADRWVRMRAWVAQQITDEARMTLRT